MNVLVPDFVPESLVYWHFTLTLLHVSWIGLVIGLLAATGIRLLRNRSANVRYWWNSVSLLAFAVSLPLTFAVVRNMSADDENHVTRTGIMTVPAPQHGALSATARTDVMLFTPDQPADDFNSDRSVRSDQSVGSDGSGQAPASAWAKCQRIAKAASPFVAELYFIGVVLMLIRLAIGVRVSHSLRAASQPISDTDLLGRMAIQAKRLSLRIMPVIAYCEHVTVPIVIGLLRPIILVPTAMINGLTPEQLESVLTHELAHLRRHDHLLIVVQRVLDVVLFFHPVTWYLSRRIHDERETCCDDLVLFIGGDRLHYAQSLLRVAELRLATTSRNDKSLTALAADGQRPSKLRQRIARLLGDSNNESVRVSSVWLVAVLAAFVAASGWVINTMAAPVVVETPDVVAPDFESIKSLVEQAHTEPGEIKAAHVRFRIARFKSGFQKELTPAKCAELLRSQDLGASPDRLRSLLKAFLSDDEQLVEEPWTNVDLYLEGSKTRTTKSSLHQGPDYWVRDGNTTLRWDAVNRQANLTRTTDDWIDEETLDYFLRLNHLVARKIAQTKPTEIARDGDLLLLRYQSGESCEETRLNLLNGCVHSHTMRSINGSIVKEKLELGWHQYNNVWLPTVVAEFDSRFNQLDACTLIVIDHASINSSLPAGIFTLGAPAGSVIVDKRDDLTQTYRINHDVHDLTSNEQLQAARPPLPAAASIGKITGHVADADGKPIADANVAVRTTSPGIPKTVQTKTDSDGRFELPFSGDAWPRHIPLRLWAWAPGYAVNVATQFASKDDLATPVSITLTIPDNVSFRVTDPEGNGVAGAVVTPSRIAIQMPNASMLTELIDILPEFLRRTSDADGIVELDSFLGASLHSLSIQSVDYGRQCFDVQQISTSLSDTNGVIRLRLQPTTQVRGRLVGAPAAFLKGIQVEVRTDVKDWPYGRVEGLATAVADDQGRFEVAAIASGELSIRQHADSEALWRIVPNRHKHTLVSGTSPEIQFVLKETVEVPFKIIRKDSGLPVVGVGVSIVDESEFHEVATGISDERGEFRARVFENSWNFASVRHMPAEFTAPTDVNDFAWFPESPVRFQSPLAAAGFEVPVVPIEVPKGRLLQGQLADPDNKPLAHWTVITQRSRGETDADGKFRVILRHNERPSDWKTNSPENSRGVPKVISESPLVLQITDYSRAVLPPSKGMYTPRIQE